MPTCRFIDIHAFGLLTRNLTIDVAEITGVMDHALVGLNKQTGFSDRMLAWIQAGASSSGPCPLDPHGRIVLDVMANTNAQGQILHTAHVLRFAPERELAPVVVVTLHSPVLDIPMRVEMPLRAVMKGNAPLEGSHTLYQHALLTSCGETYTYYGITKRGWNLRFSEHTRAALAQKSKRLFAQTLNSLIEARAEELYGAGDERPKLAGIVSTLCGTGLSQEAAWASEEYLVDKYSLSAKHPYGLNMIPGGRAGLAEIRRRFRRPGPGKGPGGTSTGLALLSDPT